MSAVVELSNLVKKYGERTVVDNVSFEIRQGEIFSLLGPNGAGKTTILSMICCVFQPTSGEARFG